MKQKKGISKIFILLILSLMLTAGYVQASPDLSSYSYKSVTSTSVYELIASKLSGMFGNIPAWNSPSRPDISSFMYISKSEAIEIAEALWPDAIWTGTPAVQLKPGVYTVILRGYTKDWAGDCPEGYFCTVTSAGGTVKIDSKTGEILSVSRWL
jgi:hypothetical protein